MNNLLRSPPLVTILVEKGGAVLPPLEVDDARVGPDNVTLVDDCWILAVFKGGGSSCVA